MPFSTAVQNRIVQQAIHYDVVRHSYTGNSSLTAEAAHVPGGQLAKSVMLEDDYGYVMAVVPATHRIDLGSVRRLLNRTLGLATEAELDDIFADCESGAIPPFGKEYGIDTIVDERLFDCADVYFVAGDHCELVHVTGEAFRELMGDVRHGRFSHHT